MQIQMSLLLQKPTALDLHCLQRQSISGFSRTRVKKFWFEDQVNSCSNLKIIFFIYIYNPCKHELSVNPSKHLQMMSTVNPYHAD